MSDTDVRPPDSATDSDRPRRLKVRSTLDDKVFQTLARGAGLLVLAITGGIGVFLATQSGIAFDTFGWRFFSELQWNPENNALGIAAILPGTVVVAAIAILVAFPLALTTALYISEYAPPRIRATLVSLLDLMAAVPSVVYGLWGFYFLQPQIIYLARWLHQAFGSFIPFLDVDTDPDAAGWEASRYTSSAFIAGVVVALMVLPIAASVMREVFAQAPPGEREAALALGSTRWGMVRAVVLPFGRGGIIGGTMLGLGRALGETIAVAMIISPAFDLDFRVLENGEITVSSLIALRFGESSALQLSALLAAGLVLFAFTLLINTLAAIVVSRSRSGSATDI
ncbi:phosphate ABC transporter permease subunit PstC [Actinokineospora sp. NBRC 105648]|uniref:phosphate ABC transporter permease subunit PstC n=1 Tax=Actinokineospora sp. NBRC 105648 TaxID=3032206 RepID=UPI0024A369B6|nr:phosphate ABC transporter permease subunit PstC [Actinokineospora sp. NBRC 105648]GLZ43070.1 phosphate transport system permease protein [Actinokineospora sp. NBRC 105648]